MILNGDGLRTSSFRMSLPTLGAISSILGVIIFCGGWIFGYMTFKADMRAISDSVVVLVNQNNALQNRINIMSQSVTDDRQTLTNRLTVLETDVKYFSQGVTELKIAVVPKR